jgi:hypothetical protein
MLDVKRGTLALDTEDPSLAEKLLTSATHQLKVGFILMISSRIRVGH